MHVNIYPRGQSEGGWIEIDTVAANDPGLLEPHEPVAAAPIGVADMPSAFTIRS